MTIKTEMAIAKIIDEAEDIPAPADNGSATSVVKEKLTQVDTLIDMASAADLFHTPDGEGYADIMVDGHRETWLLTSPGFAKWLRHKYYKATGGAANPASIIEACRTHEAKAQFEGDQKTVHLRIAEHDGRIFLYLGDEARRVIEIGPGGWSVAVNPPVRFRHTNGMRTLPLPQQGGSIDALLHFINLKSRSDFVLVTAWLLACLRSCGPYPILVVTGEQGSAKSSFLRILRNLVDPNAVPLRAVPRNERDVHIAASNAHVQAFDNVSQIPHWLSDTLCQLATGGGFATRELYADDAEKLFNAARPIMLNGIVDFVERPDLADRAVCLALEPIADEHRRTEEALNAAFIEACPNILGALLDGVVEGLKQLPKIELERLPRMADFARWATACETAFWPAGTFMTAYDQNRKVGVEQILNTDIVADAVRALMRRNGEWRGIASELLDVLTDIIGERTANSRSWPRTPQELSKRLKRASTYLRSSGIEVSQMREGRNGSRMIHISERTEARTRIAANDDVLPSDDHSPDSLNVDESKVSDQIGAITADDADDADEELRTGPEASFDIAKMANRL